MKPERCVDSQPRLSSDRLLNISCSSHEYLHPTTLVVLPGNTIRMEWTTLNPVLTAVLLTIGSQFRALLLWAHGLMNDERLGPMLLCVVATHFKLRALAVGLSVLTRCSKKCALRSIYSINKFKEIMSCVIHLI